MGFSKEFRQNIVEKVTAGSNVQAVAEEMGVSKYSIYQWVRDHRHGKTSSSRPSGLALQEKQTLLLESRGIQEDDLGGWLRRNGLHSEHLEKWKKEIDQSMQKSKDEKAENKELKKENLELKKDLRRKEKALAEVSALLILKKKLAALYGDEEK